MEHPHLQHDQSERRQYNIDDVLTTSGGVVIRFGEPPTPVPAPFASLLIELIDRRTNMRTAGVANVRKCRIPR
ncbi:hypothetical protein [Nocardia sp. NPDC059239]|uniref:hypothetical protein n=1 Tax=unclassified Nocardia TaxID=2637762 RepID=UPI003690DAAA